MTLQGHIAINDLGKCLGLLIRAYVLHQNPFHSHLGGIPKGKRKKQVFCSYLPISCRGRQVSHHHTQISVGSEPLPPLQSPPTPICSHRGVGPSEEPRPAAHYLPSRVQHLFFSAPSETAGPRGGSSRGPTLPSARAPGKRRCVLRDHTPEVLAGPNR